MVRKFLNLILNLFKDKREYSLIIEEIGSHFEVTYAKVDPARKKICLIKRKIIKHLNKLRKPWRMFDKLILALNSAHATTVESLIYLHRPRPNEIINEAELDHLIFRGLWEFLNHYRNWTAKKMSVSDLDLVLANVEIREVGLSNHRVFNPLGFKGSEFCLRLRGTFVSRHFLNLVNDFQGWAKYFAVVEDVGIVSATIPEDSDFVVHADESRTIVFSLGEAERLYHKEIPWGLANIISDLTQVLAVDDDIARIILNRHLQNKVSKRFERLIQGTVNKQFKLLLGNLTALYNKTKRSKTRPTTHFNFRFVIKPPDSFFSTSRTKLVNFTKWLELQGFSVEAKPDGVFNPKTQQNTLALLMHTYHHPQYDFLNQMLRRRAKWLVVNP